jgi:DNA replication protein DnaC
MHVNSSIIFTTNRKVEDWANIFFDPVMANAAMDRIIHQAYRIILDGESYRKNFTPKYNFEGDKSDKKI